jgi:diaminopimelate decarboxylase
MQVAVAAAVRRPHILVHGVNKSQEDLEMAIRTAGVIVVDNLAELKRLVVLRQLVEQDFPSLWLRLRPGLPVNTHSFTQTGQLDSKFGFDFEEASTAIALALQAHLPLRGLHFHQGSHFHDPQPVGQAMRAVVQFIQDVRNAHHWIPEVICPGGGWGVAYHEDDLPQPDIADYIRTVANELIQGWQALDLPLPRLQFEPGRSLVARAGVSLYRVGAVKITPHRRWVLIDGGMADNPRPALYGARYSALPVNYPQAGDWAPAWIAGPYCESGDVLIENLPLPDIFPGELLAIPVSGAYHLSMGSNYNGARKPAVVWLDSGRAALIQAREKLDDLLHRDMRLPLELLHS